MPTTTPYDSLVHAAKQALAETIQIKSPYRQASLGDADDAIPELVDIFERFHGVIGGALSNKPYPHADLRDRLFQIADQIEDLISDTVATSVEGITAQLGRLAALFELDPPGKCERDLDKRVLKSIHAGIQGIIDRAEAEHASGQEAQP